MLGKSSWQARCKYHGSRDDSTYCTKTLTVGEHPGASEMVIRRLKFRCTTALAHATRQEHMGRRGAAGLPPDTDIPSDAELDHLCSSMPGPEVADD
eukprot:9217934-Alexandrium_andersonii.AAC.1